LDAVDFISWLSLAFDSFADRCFVGIGLAAEQPPEIRAIAKRRGVGGGVIDPHRARRDRAVGEPLG
jgi:hypothetical protein